MIRTNDNYALKILDTNDYYPFGMNFLANSLIGSKFNPQASPLNYKYQEQELQETGFYAFKWRQYMPDVGRVFNINPLATKYPYNTPYAFQENKLGLGRELEGLELVKDLRHAPNSSVIVTTRPITQKTTMFGDTSKFFFGGMMSQLAGNPPNNVSVQTTQSTTSYIYKNDGKTVSSKSDANYLLVHKEETKFINNELTTMETVSTTQKQTINTYEDYTIRNGKLEQVKYRDGAMEGWTNTLFATKNVNTSATNRINSGFAQGKKDAAEIIKNLARDETTRAIVETIKIITHSMGGAYGKGYVKALKEYISTLPKDQQSQIKISLVADFDPFQGGSLKGDGNIPTFQFMHKENSNITGMGWLANEEENGKVDVTTNSGTSTDHSILSFFGDISKLQEGTYKWNEKKKGWELQ